MNDFILIPTALLALLLIGVGLQVRKKVIYKRRMEKRLMEVCFPVSPSIYGITLVEVRIRPPVCADGVDSDEIIILPSKRTFA